MDRKAQINFWYILLAVFGVLLLRDLWVQSQTITAIPYSQFETYLDDGAVGEVVIGSDTIRGTFREPQDGKTGFITTTVPPDMAARLEGTDVTYTGAVESTWLTTLLSWVLPALVFAGIWIFFIRKFAEKQGMGGFMSIGKSKAKIYVESDTKTTLERWRWVWEGPRFLKIGGRVIYRIEDVEAFERAALSRAAVAATSPRPAGHALLLGRRFPGGERHRASPYATESLGGDHAHLPDDLAPHDRRDLAVQHFDGAVDLGQTAVIDGLAIAFPASLTYAPLTHT